MTAALRRYELDTRDMPLVVWEVLMSRLSRLLVLEQGVGMFAGHAEIFALVENYLHGLEGELQLIPDILQV